MDEQKEPYNGAAVFRALVLAHRNSDLTPADKLVLVTVARHIAVVSKPPLQIAGTAFPSVEQLSELSGLSERAIRNSLSRIVAAGLLRTTPIPGRLLRGRRDQAKWDARRFHTTAPWDEIPSPYTKDGAAADPPATPVTAPPLTPEEEKKEQEVLDDLDERPARKQSKEDQQRADDLANWMKRQFSDHPTMQEKNWRRMIDPAVRLMLELTCSRTQEVMNCLQAEEDRISESKRLGGFLEKSYPGWWAEAVAGDMVDTVIREGGQAGFEVTVEDVFRGDLHAALRKRLGSHLQQYEFQRDNEGLTLRIRISDEYCQVHPVDNDAGDDSDVDAGGAEGSSARSAVYQLDDNGDWEG